MARKITLRSGPDAGTTKEVPEQSISDAARGVFGHGSVTGSNDEESQLHDLDASNSSQEASNAGRQAQSTDHMNNP